MLDYADLIARLEELPISEANRSIARAHYIAAEANADRIARACDWLSGVAGKWGRQRAVKALKSNSLLTA
jgi:hypothetical protein